MTDNPLILAPVETLVAGFFVRSPDGTTEEDDETREKLRRKFEHLRMFLSRNNLLTTPIVDGSGRLMDIPLRRSDVSDDGFQLLRTKMATWLDSKASDADPPKMNALVKALAEIRSR
jgi:hypothetical protein